MNLEKPTIANICGLSVEVCFFWDFIAKVKRDYCREAMDLYSHHLRQEMGAVRDYQFTPDTGLYATTYHKLKQNPMGLLTELRKTTTEVKLTKSVILEDIILDQGRRCIEDYGMPTHIFTIGENRIAMVNIEDCKLYVNKNMKQQLVCHHPKRNFNIYAPNLEFKL